MNMFVPCPSLSLWTLSMEAFLKKEDYASLSFSVDYIALGFTWDPDRVYYFLSIWQLTNRSTQDPHQGVAPISPLHYQGAPAVSWPSTCILGTNKAEILRAGISPELLTFRVTEGKLQNDITSRWDGWQYLKAVKIKVVPNDTQSLKFLQFCCGWTTIILTNSSPSKMFERYLYWIKHAFYPVRVASCPVKSWCCLGRQTGV